MSSPALDRGVSLAPFPRQGGLRAILAGMSCRYYGLAAGGGRGWRVVGLCSLVVGDEILALRCLSNLMVGKERRRSLCHGSWPASRVLEYKHAWPYGQNRPVIMSKSH
jgi:hypothetical protein